MTDGICILCCWWEKKIILQNSQGKVVWYSLCACKFSIFWCTNRFPVMHMCICSAIDHWWRQNVVRTQKWHTRHRHLLWSVTVQTLSNMGSYLFFTIKKQTVFSDDIIFVLVLKILAQFSLLYNYYYFIGSPFHWHVTVECRTLGQQKRWSIEWKKYGKQAQVTGVFIYKICFCSWHWLSWSYSRNVQKRLHCFWTIQVCHVWPRSNFTAWRHDCCTSWYCSQCLCGWRWVSDFLWCLQIKIIWNNK